VPSDPGGDPDRLLSDVLGWLPSTYPEHGIFVERDLVWALRRTALDPRPLMG
jgi:hypothetical protein